MKAAVMLLGAAAVAYFAIVFRTAWALIKPQRDYSPEGYVSTELPFESIAFKSRTGLRLAGWLAIQDDALGTIVLCHGVWTDHREMESRAAALWDRGFSVMTFDFQGSGESDGRFTTLGMREVGDLLGALDYLSARTGVGPIGVLGNSMGGAVGLLTAARDPRIACVATDGAFAAADRDFVAHAFHGATGVPPSPFQDAVVVVSELLSGSRLDRVRPVDSIGKIAPRPVLLVHGAEDELVRSDHAHRLHEAADDPKDLWIVSGARHVESFDVQREEYVDRMERFFRGAFKLDPN